MDSLRIPGVQNRGEMKAITNYPCHQCGMTYDEAMALTPGEALTVLQNQWNNERLAEHRKNPPEADSETWLTAAQAAEIISCVSQNVGRNAGPEGSGEPIVDNGVKGSGRRFTKTSVVEYAADKRSRDNAREDAPESDAAVAKKMRDAER